MPYLGGGGPYNKDPAIWGTILESPIFWKLHSKTARCGDFCRMRAVGARELKTKAMKMSERARGQHRVSGNPHKVADRTIEQSIGYRSESDMKSNTNKKNKNASVPHMTTTEQP